MVAIQDPSMMKKVASMTTCLHPFSGSMAHGNCSTATAAMEMFPRELMTVSFKVCGVQALFQFSFLML